MGPNPGSGQVVASLTDTVTSAMFGVGEVAREMASFDVRGHWKQERAS